MSRVSDNESRIQVILARLSSQAWLGADALPDEVSQFLKLANRAAVKVLFAIEGQVQPGSSSLPLTPSNDLVFYLDVYRRRAEDYESDDDSDDERYNVDKDPFRDYFTIDLAIAKQDQFSFVEQKAPDGTVKLAVEVCPLYFEVTDDKPDDVFVAINMSLKLKKQTGPREIKPDEDMGHWLEINHLSVTKHLRQHSVMTTLMTNIFQVLYDVCGDMYVYTDPDHVATSLLLCTTEDERVAVKAEFGKWGGFTKSDNTLAVLTPYHIARISSRLADRVEIVALPFDAATGTAAGGAAASAGLFQRVSPRVLLLDAEIEHSSSVTPDAMWFKKY
ncbi:MAG: hypothetical protein P1U40_10145 [Coxiellaceae bacterium]|nr:hypothetical protein [Coxiellaceae bacterium]